MKTVRNIYQEISALTWKEDNLFVAKAVGIEVASQGKTKKEALSNLKEALELYFENEPKLVVNSSQKNLTLEKICIQYA
jgi:predicted RNase H-like HicB family nuclease